MVVRNFCHLFLSLELLRARIRSTVNFDSDVQPDRDYIFQEVLNHEIKVGRNKSVRSPKDSF